MRSASGRTGCGALRTLRRRASMALPAMAGQRSGRFATLRPGRPGARQRLWACGHRGTRPTPWGRSGQGPRTHEVAPLWFEARLPRLEGPALPDPTASALQAALEDCLHSPAERRLQHPGPMPAADCRKSTTATRKVEVAGGRAGLGPRGAAAALRATEAPLRVFEGPALNGPPRPRPCTPRSSKANGALRGAEEGASNRLPPMSATRRRQSVQRLRKSTSGCRAQRRVVTAHARRSR